MNKNAFKAWSSTTVSAIYEKARPKYNIDSVEFLLEKVGALKTHSEFQPFTIVELGAGTGKFTRAVLSVLEKRAVKNVKIISTEPIKEMCEKFKEMVPNNEILQRRADNLGLPNNSADAVLAAECLHWFSNAESFQEIHRVLKLNGSLGMIWNNPDRSVSWIKCMMEMLDVRFKRRNMPHPDIKDWHLKIKQHGGFAPLNICEHSYKYNMELDLGGVLDLYNSFSIVSSAESAEKEEILSEVVNEMKTNPELKDSEVHTYSFASKIEWVQKLDS